MTYSRIAGIGSYLPEKVLTNKGMDGAVGGSNDTVLMGLEDYDTALTFDDFALEVILAIFVNAKLK